MDKEILLSTKIGCLSIEMHERKSSNHCFYIGIFAMNVSFVYTVIIIHKILNLGSQTYDYV